MLASAVINMRNFYSFAVVFALTTRLVTNTSHSLEFMDKTFTECDSKSNETTIYEYDMTTLEGEVTALKNFENMVLLMVNVATFCHFTVQYIQLNELMEKYGPPITKKSKDNFSQYTYKNGLTTLEEEEEQEEEEDSMFRCRLQILGFPSDQFSNQEPSMNKEIKRCLYYVRPGNGFVPLFPLSEKIYVNGENESSIFTYIKERCPTNANLVNTTSASWSPIRNHDIPWNFEKILVDHNGFPFLRLDHAADPNDLIPYIEGLMKYCEKDLGSNTIFDSNGLRYSKYDRIEQ